MEVAAKTIRSRPGVGRDSKRSWVLVSLKEAANIEHTYRCPLLMSRYVAQCMYGVRSCVEATILLPSDTLDAIAFNARL